MSEVWVGLDLGTQGARAVALTETGEVVGRGARPLTSRRTPGRHEQDPDHWWAAGSAAIAEAVADLPENAVSGVAIDATSGTVLVADHHGRAPDPGADVRRQPRRRRPARPGQQGRRAAVGAARLPADAGRLGPAQAALAARAPPRGTPRPAPAPGRPRGRPPGRHRVRPGGGHRPQQRAEDRRRPDRRGLARRAARARWACPRRSSPSWCDRAPRSASSARAAAAATGLQAGTPVLAGAHRRLRLPSSPPAPSSRAAGTSCSAPRWSSRASPPRCCTTREGSSTATRLPAASGCPAAPRAPAPASWPPDFDEARLDDLTAAAPDHEPAGSVTYPLAGEGERFPFVAPDARGFALREPRDEAERFAAVLQGVAFVERLSLDVPRPPRRTPRRASRQHRRRIVQRLLDPAASRRHRS